MTIIWALVANCFLYIQEPPCAEFPSILVIRHRSHVKSERLRVSSCTYSIGIEACTTSPECSLHISYIFENFTPNALL